MTDLELKIDFIYLGDVLKTLKCFPDKSVQMVITSPPYYALRDYGVKGQIGLEETPKKYISKLVNIFREIRRVLKDDGTIWVNIGDSYSSKGKTRTTEQCITKSNLNGGYESQIACKSQINKVTGTLKPKDLIGIPWMLAFALRNDGWYLRQDIIWSKPNPMPESVTDRCTKSHEYIFMLSKSSKYYYDASAIRTKPAESSLNRYNQDIDNQSGSERVPGKTNGRMKAVGNMLRVDKQMGHGRRHAGFNERWDLMNKEEQAANGANKRSVWNVATKPFKEAHFATFPIELILDPIKSGCPENGLVLDPFMGSGTTAIAAKILNRHYVGIELNADYIKIANSRIHKEIGLFK